MESIWTDGQKIEKRCFDKNIISSERLEENCDRCIASQNRAQLQLLSHYWSRESSRHLKALNLLLRRIQRSFSFVSYFVCGSRRGIRSFHLSAEKIFIARDTAGPDIQTRLVKNKKLRYGVPTRLGRFALTQRRRAGTPLSSTRGSLQRSPVRDRVGDPLANLVNPQTACKYAKCPALGHWQVEEIRSCGGRCSRPRGWGPRRDEHLLSSNQRMARQNGPTRWHAPGGP